MRRKTTKTKSSYSDSSEDEPSPQKPPKIPKPTDDSSSESDIENYLQPIDQIDLNSSFFNIQKDIPSTVDQIEDDVFEPDEEPDPVETPSTSESHFQQLHDYTKKMEEAKKSVEEYKTKKQTEKKQTDVSDLLAAKEAKLNEDGYDDLDITLRSSDFESCSDSENEGWEEVAEAQSIIPRENLEITVEMPGVIKKKKREDLDAVIKRRINRIKKLNQLLIHKVHLLCWIAHGNYVNAAINSENVLAVALSLVPPEPARPTDLNCIKQLVKWYKNVVRTVEKTVPKNKTLEELLEAQIAKKVAYDKAMFVYMFVAVLRSLRVPCRLILSLRVEPVRPPKSELLSLSTKNSTVKSRRSKCNTPKPEIGKNKSKNEQTSKQIKKAKTAGSSEQKVEVTKKTRSKNAADTERNESAEVKSEITRKTRSKSAAEAKKVDFSKEEKVETKKKTSLINATEIKRTRSKSAAEATKVEFSEEEKVETTKKTRLRKAPEPETKEVKKTRSKGAAEAKTVELPKEKVETTKKTRLRNATEVEAKDIKKTRSTTAAEAKQIELSTRKIRSKYATEGKNEELLEGKNEELLEGKSEEIRKTRSKSAAEAKTGLQLEETRITRSKSVATGDQQTNKTGSKRTDENRTKKSSKLETKEKKPQTSSTLITSYFKNAKTNTRVGGNKSSIVKTKPSPRLRSQTSPKIPQLDGPNDDSSDDEVSSLGYGNSTITSRPKLRTLPRRLVKRMERHKGSGSDEDDLTVRTPFSPKNTASPQTKAKRILQNQSKDRETARKRRSYEDSDSDYIPETKRKHPRSDDFTPLEEIKEAKKQNEVENNTQGLDFWVEVFSEAEKRWVSVDVIDGQVDCVNELYAKATPPISYVLAWNNNNTLKDVTSRYCRNFNTTTRGLRIDPKWWTKTLKPFAGPKTVRDKEEDEELERQQLETPLPKSFKEYKNHPLYVLKRHLLKYEAIYPPDAPTLGFVRREPVYPRQCVYILHPRDIWLKKAKVVKLGEKPYKIVKGRPRWDKWAHKIVTDPQMDIFGPWQVEDYDPPTAENGVVPRNAYGNVELFKPCMLPKKTVHLKLPGLNKIARRMNIDCASAFTGFDYSKGWVHPAYDGYVVCEENADILVAAWELEQDELEEREQEKIDKRVYGNWKRLIKGLLIRERLKAKYEFGDVSRGDSDKKAKKGPRFSTKKRK